MITVFANLTDGLQNLSLFDEAFAQSAAGVVTEPTQVTGSSSTILPNTVYNGGTPIIAVRRVAPTLTTLYMPDIILQGNIPIIIFDWSESVTDHEIRCIPSGVQTIGRQASYSLFSNSVQLSGAKFYPSVDLLGWYIAP